MSATQVRARRFRRVVAALPWTLFALVLAFGAVSLPLADAAKQLDAIDVLNDVGVALLTVVLAGVGLVVAWHQPRNALGWLLLGSGMFFVLNAAASSLEVADYRVHRHLPLGPAGRSPSRSRRSSATTSR